MQHIGRLIPPGFLGLGFEYKTLPRYTGDNPQAVNPVLEQLIRNLTPGQAPVLRLGGDTTDRSWWPVGGMQAPPLLSYALTPLWAAVVHTLSQNLDARLIMDTNIQADSKVIAATEAQALIGGIGRGSIEALELGNEPELYKTFGWYQTPSGSEAPARPGDWSFAMFESAFTSIASTLPTTPLAAPATSKETLDWDSELSSVLTGDPRVRTATVHRYPLWVSTQPNSTLHPTVAHVLSASASAGLAASVSNVVRVAHNHMIPLRVDEMNITPCPYQALVLRSSFATALWALDALFEMASQGIDGVNVQASTAATDDLFTFNQIGHGWQAAVTPEYHGLLMFAKTAPAGSRVVPFFAAPRAPLHTWSTQARDGAVRVIMINDGLTPRVIALNAPRTRAPATLDRLFAPTPGPEQGVRLDGQTFGAWTGTGRLVGPKKLVVLKASGNRYVFTLPARGADLLTIK